MIMPLCNRIFCCIFGWYFYVISGRNLKKKELWWGRTGVLMRGGPPVGGAGGGGRYSRPSSGSPGCCSGRCTSGTCNKNQGKAFLQIQVFSDNILFWVDISNTIIWLLRNLICKKLTPCKHSYNFLHTISMSMSFFCSIKLFSASYKLK